MSLDEQYINDKHEEFTEDTIEMPEENFFLSYNMIFEQDVSIHALAVYVYLCRCGFDKKSAYPKRITIAKNCKIGIRTVDKAIKELIEIGLLSKEPQYFNGRQISNLYRIYKQPRKPKKQGEAQEVHKRGAQDMHSMSAGDAQHGRRICTAKEDLLVTRSSCKCVGDKPPQDTHQNTKKTDEEEKKSFGDNGLVLLTDKEYKAFCELMTPETALYYIGRFDRYLKGIGVKNARKYTHHYSAIINWWNDDVRELKNKADAPVIKRNRVNNFPARMNNYDELELLERQLLLSKLGK